MPYVFQFDLNCIQQTVDETHKIDDDGDGDDHHDNDDEYGETKVIKC